MGDQETGLRVAPKNVRAWQLALQQAGAMSTQWDEFRAVIQRPLDHAACASVHLQTFRQRLVCAESPIA